MSPREWIAALRQEGMTVILNEGPNAEVMPFLVYFEDDRPTGPIWRRFAADLQSIGFEAITDELRRERLH